MAFFGLFLPVLGERTLDLQPDLIEVENAPKMNPQYINISAYKFVPIKDPVAVKADLLPKCKSLELKGTILVSLEGINMFVAGARPAIDEFLQYVETSYPDFHDLPVKESLSDHQPFSRMLVRLKKEIISMGVESIVPAVRTSPKLKAAELKKWLDEGRDITLLDVRNDYEIEVGTFTQAVPVGVDHFRKFPEAIESISEEARKKPLVMFCTGGIRCEKAGPLMQREGFEEVYQLDGGILRYFEEVGGDHYDGECFVFDKRVAVDSTLAESDYEQCYACQRVLTKEDQQSEHYDPPNRCGHCYQSEESKLRSAALLRTEQVLAATDPLPGSVAYDNVRPMNVPLRFDQKPVMDFLLAMHANLDRDFWQERLDQGRICFKEQVLNSHSIVRSGWRIEHRTPETTEPPVSNEVEIIYEDEALVVVNKPAPLPMHPCGRFNRNTLGYFLKLVYDDRQLRQTHRLDANTTGVVLYATKKRHSQKIFPQFAQGTVVKTYLALVEGVPEKDQFRCEAPISKQASATGAREVSEDGQDALTEFEVLQRRDDGKTLVLCRPKTGRTNQIRIHLAHLGFPICGDPAYNPSVNNLSATNEKTQTLGVGDAPMCLHAWKLEVDHPETGDRQEFVADKPAWA